jgi:biopolymer transport protein TolR
MKSAVRGAGGAARAAAGRAAAMSEINVTPFVDVMLVLLIIFMVAAPLLTVGVPVELPDTAATRFADRTGRAVDADGNGRWQD